MTKIYIHIQTAQQKAYQKNKNWMNQSNQEYLSARFKKLPTVNSIVLPLYNIKFLTRFYRQKTFILKHGMKLKNLQVQLMLHLQCF